MHAAYDSGMVFDGEIDIPIIDWRHYLEDELDMHHSHQSFATRQRMLDARRRRRQPGDLVHRRPARDRVRPDPDGVRGDRRVDGATSRRTPSAAWPRTARRRRSTPASTPTGSSRVRGRRVGGRPRRRHRAPARSASTIYSSSRRQAGGPFRGGVFKCELQPVADAIARRRLRRLATDAAEQARLEQIFPTGVCDFSKPDAGRPGT